MGRVSAIQACFFASIIGMISAQIPPDCLFTDHYCKPPATPPLTLQEKGQAAYDKCYDECFNKKDDQAEPCTGFTVWEIGSRITYCYLLTEACDYNTDDECFAKNKCISGPADCDALPTGCLALAATADDNVANWVCTDEMGDIISGASDPMPVGSVCSQSCPAWRSEADPPAPVVVESTCQPDNSWSLPENIDGTAVTYPTDTLLDPSEPPLACGCESLEIRWPYTSDGYSYDPNVEEGTDFICDQPLDLTDGVYSIAPNNYCKLFCDDHYVATAQCLDGEWTGNPEWGFWCYTEPAEAPPAF